MNLRAASALVFALFLGACALPPSPPPAPLSVESSVAALTARSLSDPGLRRFLAENLGHEPVAKWDFESLAWVAFYYHPSLDIARAQWASARAAQQVASTRPNPTISLVPGYNSTREPGLSPWFPGVSLDFLLGSEKRARLAAGARSEAEAARLAVISAAWQVRSELRRALLDVQLADKRARQLTEQIALEKNILALLDDRLTAGRATLLEISLARTALLKAESAAAAARGQGSSARIRVASALGLAVSALDGIDLPLPPVATQLAPPALAEARKLALRTRSDLLIAFVRYESSQAALAVEVLKQRPDLHLGPGYQWDQGANKWSLALTFELPLFNRNEASVAQALARRSEAAAQVVAVQAQALASLDNAFNDYAVAEQNYDRTYLFSGEAMKQSEAAMQRLEHGAADQLEVQISRLENINASLARDEAVIGEAVAAGQIEDALQIPFPRLSALTP